MAFIFLILFSGRAVPIASLACAALLAAGALFGVTAEAAGTESLVVTPRDAPAYLADLTRRLKDYPAVQNTLTAEGPLAAYQEMGRLLPPDSRDARAWALLGELALAAHQAKPAELALEQAVLLDPDLAGAWVDLSLALLELGEARQARQYLDYVQQEFAPNPAIKDALQQLGGQADQLRAAQERWHYAATMGGGFDSNANNGLRSTSLILTSGADLLPLTLNPNFLARGSAFGVVGLEGHREQPLPDTDWTLNYGYSLLQKQFANVSAFSSTEVVLHLQGSRPSQTGGNWILGGQVENYLLGGSEFLGVVRATVAQDLPWGDCRLMPGAELEERRNYLDLTLSGRVWWMFGQATCQRGAWMSGATLRYGLDQAIFDRVGGTTDRAEGYFYVGKFLTEAIQARATAGYTWAQDRSGYNPLLENNAIRHLSHWLGRAELIQRWAPQWEGVLSVERNVIDSNLTLFQQNDWVEALTVRFYF